MVRAEPVSEWRYRAGDDAKVGGGTGMGIEYEICPFKFAYLAAMGAMHRKNENFFEGQGIGRHFRSLMKCCA